MPQLYVCFCIQDVDGISKPAFGSFRKTQTGNEDNQVRHYGVIYAISTGSDECMYTNFWH